VRRLGWIRARASDAEDGRPALGGCGSCSDGVCDSKPELRLVESCPSAGVVVRLLAVVDGDVAVLETRRLIELAARGEVKRSNADVLAESDLGPSVEAGVRVGVELMAKEARALWVARAGEVDTVATAVDARREEVLADDTVAARPGV
jgi:hypothetical protein